MRDIRTYIRLLGMQCGFINGEKRHFVADSCLAGKTIAFPEVRSGNGKEVKEVTTPAPSVKVLI